MKIKHEQFIGVYEDVFPEGFCEHLVSEFERLNSAGVSLSRKKTDNSKKHHKDDTQIFMHMRISRPEPFNGEESDTVFYRGLQACFNNYSEEYSVLTQDNLRCDSMKAQRIDSGGGYHVWHCEQGGGLHASRAIVYMLYLNTLTEESCGETEFLYQGKRFSPKKNTMLIWPAGFTHAHRGNPVYGDSKYIVTGWFHYD